MKDRLVIFGASTTAKSIYGFVKDYDLFDVLGFVQDKEYKTFDSFCDLPVYDFVALSSVFNKDRDLIFVAMEWNRLNADRRRHYERLKSCGYKFANIISPHALIHGKLVGNNCWICDNVVVENDAVVCDDVFIKPGAIVQHNTIIHSHCFVGAHTTLAGNVSVGEQSYLGVSSVVFNRVTIGKKCIVGGGVVMKRNLPDYSIIKTPNEQYVVKQYDDDTIEEKLLASVVVR